MLISSSDCARQAIVVPTVTAIISLTVNDSLPPEEILLPYLQKRSKPLKVACISIWNPFEIVLMFGLCQPKRSHRL